MTTNLLFSVNFFARRRLFLIAAVLVMACQLVAMAMLADGQVARAGQRRLAIALEQTAVAQCSESLSPSAQNACLLRTRLASSGEPAFAAETVLPNASFSPQITSPAKAAERAPGLTAASYPGQ
jgi:endonuclease/exonuclease/phosphatase (EEP) superfamily protein YafD